MSTLEREPSLWRFLMMHVCIALPWHKLAHVAWTKAGCEHVRCQWCKREYGINDRVNMILPWEDVKEIHNG